MFLHIFIIFAMNNITNGLEFMQVDQIELKPKMVFLIASFILYFGFLFSLGFRYAKTRCKNYIRLCVIAAGLGIAFTGLMVLLRENMAINIALTVAFVFGMFGMIYWYGRRIEDVEVAQ